MSKEITLPSGNRLVVGQISWDEVCELRLYACNTLKSLTVKGETFEAAILAAKEVPYYLECADFRNMFFGFAGRSCIKRRAGNEIVTDSLNPAYFEKREHWQDYYPACWAILEYNLAPFIDGLKSLLPKNWMTLLEKLIEMNKNKTLG